MNKKEYYKRIEKINNRFKTDRVSADEKYQLVCERNYLSTKYIANLEQQVKKQKQAIDKAIEYIKSNVYKEDNGCGNYWWEITDKDELLKILENKEVSE